MAEHLTASQHILQAARATETVEDARGRQIEVRKLGRAELMRCMRQWGQACNVEAWFAMALMAASVSSIDGKPIPMPQSVIQVESIAEMLGEEGSRAVEEWYQEQAAPDLGEIRAQAKN